MSWGVSVPKQPLETFLKAVEATRIEDTYNTPELVAQWSEQLEGAKAAIGAILSRDVFGQEDAEFSASMSGHANHDEAGKDTTYMTDEFVNVTLSRRPVKGQSEK